MPSIFPSVEGHVTPCGLQVREATFWGFRADEGEESPALGGGEEVGVALEVALDHGGSELLIRKSAVTAARDDGLDERVLVSPELRSASKQSSAMKVNPSVVIAARASAPEEPLSIIPVSAGKKN